MTARIKITDLHALPANYTLELYEAGHIAGDFLLLPMDDFNEVKRRFNKPKTKLRGLGDLIHKIALPIAKALNLGCVDKKTNQLRPESPCAKRRESLNQSVPFNQK